jgi:acetylornithine/N-succinyldiaminopimelate aminotransferase
MIKLVQQSSDNKEYLTNTKLINYESIEVSSLAKQLDISSDNEIPSIIKAYEYVRDQIPHTIDAKRTEVAQSASDVIQLGHGLCYAKAHLLAALLRYAGIPSGICYQRICLDNPNEFGSEDTFDKRLVLHAVNAVFIKSINKWVRMDARGNSGIINAQFSTGKEQLAFSVHPEYREEDGYIIYQDTPNTIAKSLDAHSSSIELMENLPSYIIETGSILFTSKRPEIVMEKGKGMYLWDTEGQKYLDFVAGWAVNSLGHSPDVISNALQKQSAELVNCSPSFYNTKMLKLADLLTRNSCFDKVFFASSGAEANESAIKLARKYGSKYKNEAYEIITTVDGFHGRTLATMSATGKAYWEPLFAPKVSGFVHVPFNDADSVLAAITDKTCAVMLEPIQGEGGVNVADENYIKELRKICDENNILLIFDEIQTGAGRTGRLFAYEYYGVEPDIMTLGKGIGGGFPLSAMLTKKKFDIFDAGDQGGSYSSQPLAMSVGYAVLNEIIEANLCEHAADMGKYIVEKLDAVKDKLNIKNIRGKGLLIAFDLPTGNAAEVVSKCLQNGLAVNSPKPATIRLMPALIVSEEDIDKMMSILYKVLTCSANDQH